MREPDDSRRPDPLAPVPDAAELTAEQREQAETEADLLEQLVGEELAGALDSLAHRDPRFVAWKREQGAAHPRRRSDEELRRMGQRLRSQVLATRLGMERAAHRAPERAPTVVGMAGQVLEYAESQRAAPLVDLAVAAGSGRELWNEPVESWVERPEGVPAGHYLALRIAGDSMTPVMHSGDTVLVRIGPALALDTVVIARVPDDGYVCKRVSRLRSLTIELASLDPSRPPITIPRDPGLILGTVIFVWCHHDRGAKTG